MSIDFKAISQMFKSVVAWLVLALTTTFLIVACQNSPTPEASTSPTDVSSSPVVGGELVIGLEADIQAVDPAFTYDFTTSPVVNQITEGLLKFENGEKVVPNLAESVENPDPLTYIYKIRQGVTFQDGSPMTVEDVIFSMERTRDPKTASYVGWMYDSVDQITKVDAQTVKVTLKNPDAFWQYVPATTAGHVISQAYYKSKASTFGKPEGGLIGTGPFKFVSWSTGSEIVLERNDNYWDKANGGPYLDKVTYKILPESTTRVAGLQTGELSMLMGTGVPSDQLPVITKNDKVNLTLADSYLSNLIAFNTQIAPFNNVKVRQALNYAIDKTQITKTLLGDAGTLAKAVPVSPRIWVFNKDQWQAGYDKLPDYAVNLEKAKQLLAESGVADQVNGKTITVDDNSVRLGQALALQSAAKALGVDLKIGKITGQELISRSFSSKRDYDIMVTNWGSDFPDPAGNLLPVFHSRYTGDGGSNFGNYKNPDLDKLLDQQNSVTDNTKRTDLMIQAQQIIADQSIWIVFDYPKQVLAINKNFSGYEITPMWYWDAFAKNIHKKA
jgi:peptide/nickel transport system substrate-binding protein